MDYIEIPKVPDVVMKKGRRVFKGTLHLMTHHLLFNSDNSNEQELWIAYSTIQNVDLKNYINNKDSGYEIHISCKNFLFIQFTILSEKKACEVFDSLKKLINITTVDEHYAFFYKPLEKFTSHDGWRIYNPIKEYERLGYGKPDCEWRATAINKQYKFSITYPQILFVPKNISDNILNYAVKFRSKGRIPVLSYLHKKNNMSITRSSQPMVGIKQNRSMQDEKLVEEIFATASKNKSKNYKNLIVDARSSTNAMANVAMGAGYENVEHYKGSRLEYLKIENIHVVRDSLNKLIEISRNSNNGFIQRSEIEKTGWLKHIHTLLEGSLLIIKNIDLYNSHVLVHCSDGWDRTAQLVAISEVCLDPYYRTIEGFEVLVEKEWISFGHKFSHRCGLLAKDSANLNEVISNTASKIFNNKSSSLTNKESATSAAISSTINAVSNITLAASKFLKFGAANINNITNQKDQVPQASSMDSVSKNSTLPRETSPIFTQFLDCIYQLWVQNPTQFEFNDDFLVQLNTHVYSSQFGTFLFNSEYERRVFRHEGKDLSQCTYSVWDWFNSNKKSYINPRYVPPTKDSPNIITESQQIINEFEDSLNNDNHNSLLSNSQAQFKVIYPKTNERVIKYWSNLYNRTDDEMNGLEQTHSSSNKIVNNNNNNNNNYNNDINSNSFDHHHSEFNNDNRNSTTSISTPLDYNSLAATITDTTNIEVPPIGRDSFHYSSSSIDNSNRQSIQSINSKSSHDSVYSSLKEKIENSEDYDVLFGSPFQSLKSQSKLSNSNSSSNTSLPPNHINAEIISSHTSNSNLNLSSSINKEMNNNTNLVVSTDTTIVANENNASSPKHNPEYYTKPNYSQINDSSISSMPQMATAESTFVHPLE